PITMTVTSPQSKVLDSAFCFASRGLGRVDEDPRSDHALCLLNFTHQLALRFQNDSQLRCERRLARLGRSLSLLAPLATSHWQINVAPLAGQYSQTKIRRSRFRSRARNHDRGSRPTPADAAPGLQPAVSPVSADEIGR